MLSSYARVICSTAKEGFIYKTASFFSIVNRLIEISIYLFVWKAVYSSSGSIEGMEFSNMVIYYVITFSISHIMYFGTNEEMGEKIRNGTITMELLYPISYMDYYFSYKLGNTLRQVVLVVIPTFIITTLLFSVNININLINFGQFIIILMLAIVNVFFIEFIFGMVAFVTNSLWGLQTLKNSLIMIFSGAIAPITLFPQFMQVIMEKLPFVDFIYSPVNALIGNVDFIEFVNIIFRESIWAIILFIIANILYKKLIKKVTIFGG